MNGIRTHDLCAASAVLYQQSSWVRISFRPGCLSRNLCCVVWFSSPACKIGFYACFRLVSLYHLLLTFLHSPAAFVSYLGFVNVLVAHSHPVMLVFCHLLVNRNNDRGLEESKANDQSVTNVKERSSKDADSSVGTSLHSAFR